MVQQCSHSSLDLACTVDVVVALLQCQECIQFFHHRAFLFPVSEDHCLPLNNTCDAASTIVLQETAVVVVVVVQRGAVVDAVALSLQLLLFCCSSLVVVAAAAAAAAG